MLQENAHLRLGRSSIPIGKRETGALGLDTLDLGRVPSIRVPPATSQAYERTSPLIDGVFEPYLRALVCCCRLAYCRAGLEGRIVAGKVNRGTVRLEVDREAAAPIKLHFGECFAGDSCRCGDVGGRYDGCGGSRTRDGGRSGDGCRE